MMKIGFFGALGDLVARSIDLDLPASIVNVGQLRDYLSGQYPIAGPLLSDDRSRCVVEGSLVESGCSLQGVELVEFLPPVSGG